jgi:hypothetical protein
LACACVLALAGAAPALAQFMPGPGQSSQGGQFSPGNDPAFPPPPGQRGPAGPGGAPPGGGFPPPPGQAVCATFPQIRKAAEEGAAAIRNAGQRKAPREEVCGLFKNFVAKEARLVRFLADNKTACGVPPQAIAGAKANHVKTVALTKTVCSGGPSGPAGPSLSDALGSPIVADDNSAKLPGRGTFDTLTGNVLSR